MRLEGSFDTPHFASTQDEDYKTDHAAQFLKFSGFRQV